MDEQPINVLLIEDDEDDYLLTRELFSELPSGAYRLDRVADYDSALETFQRFKHDVYLVDYRLGSHNGLQLIGPAQQRGCHGPFIILTGQRQREIDLEAMKAGAVDFLVKDGLDAASLERSMRYALQHKRHEEAIRRVNQQLEERVRQRTADLARVNETLQQEIADRKRAEEALREADRRKDEFLATLAHELRNPLAPLSSALQLLELEPHDVRQVQKLREVMARQVEQLVRLIDDLLDVSRIMRGKLNLRRQRLPLSEVLESALDVSRPFIDAAGHTFRTELPSAPLVVEGDKVRLAQVISNLLINAAKYTPRGGLIELLVTAEQGQGVIRVRDNGIGIPPTMLPRIFDLFTQVDGSATRSHGGLGIGLTLVKTLVEMHGGTVEADSPGAGRGTTFSVRLPLANVSSPVSADAFAQRPLVGKSLPALRVLVVDDNEPAAHLLGRLLEKLGQHVHTVHSAPEALDVLPALKPDIVISDIAMPEVSGYDLARQIRANRYLSQPVLIALTGYGQESDRQQSSEAGFDYHLSKPISVHGLEDLLASLGKE